MYTKEQLIDQVLINVSGGELSDDVNVWREDIEAFVPAAIAAALVEDLQFRLERESLQNRRMGVNIMPKAGSEYTLTYLLDVLFDEDRTLHYILPPGRLLKLPGESGLSQVVPLNGRPATIVRGQGETIGLEEVGQVFAWVEHYKDEDRIILYNHSPTVKQVLLHAIIGPGDLNDDDILPLPDHLETRVLEFCTAFFREQRGMPADPKLDNTDVNEIGNY